MAKMNEWMSVSDLMTGLMVIFLFIAIAYIKKAQSQQSTLIDYDKNRKELYNTLVKEFKQEQENNTITISDDLSMRFEDAGTLFESNSCELTETYKDQLSVIIPKYFNILLKASLRDKIKEIRIEGHTDDTSERSDPYMSNLEVSQKRAYNVMQYIHSLDAFKNRDPKEKDLLEYWFTANGFSYGHALDVDGNFALISRKRIDRDNSRRVEFRILTSGDEIVKEFVKSINE